MAEVGRFRELIVGMYGKTHWHKKDWLVVEPPL